MTESQAIEYANKLTDLEKLSYYMNYFCNCLGDQPISVKRQEKDNASFGRLNFEYFCSENNIVKHDVGDKWKENGFATKQLISLTPGSLFHSVYHNLKLI